MNGASTSAADLRDEIARLTGAIDRFKATDFKSRSSTFQPNGRPRSNVYVNPNYKSADKPQTPAPQQRRPPQRPPPTSTHPDEKREVIIGGVAFESSGRSLVRKDLTMSKPTPPSTKPPLPQASFSGSHAAQFVAKKMPRPTGRVYKPKMSRRGRPRNFNMTLTNDRRPNGTRRRKFVDKPCPRFNTTGVCNRGLTCPYRHDPANIAICWPFLQGTCPHTDSTCPLSHDPTPERTPLCVHFANAGRCTRANCPFPHVKVGPREGVCRDFAVLGYCEKGLDCEHQHVRECPDFAEKGVCGTKGCKLPHVIRANRNRPKVASKAPTISDVSLPGGSEAADVDTNTAPSPPTVTAEDAQLGDEYISLTFMESESEDDEDEDEDYAQSGDGDGEEGNLSHPEQEDNT